MQIRYKNNGVVKHVHNDVGRGFIDAGLAEEFIPAPPRPWPNTTWQILPGERRDHSPFIHAHCSSCNQPAIAAGATAGQTMRFLHCGTVEYVPAHISKRYLKAYSDFAKGIDAMQPSSVSASQREIERKRIERIEKARRVAPSAGVR